MTFQDELLGLLGSFNVRHPRDFDMLQPDRKHHFVSRLYKCFQRGVRDLGQELAQLRGLKLHYQRGLRPTSPRMEDTFVKKLAFYSSHFVVTCPIQEMSSSAKPSKSKRIKGRERYDSATLRTLRTKNHYVFGDVKAHERTHGGEIHIHGKAYIIDRSDLVELITTILSLRDAIKAGIVHVLPSLPSEERKLGAELRKASVVRGNFERNELVRQFTEQDLKVGNALVDAGLTRIFLPHLTGVPLEEILEVRQRDNEAYNEFQIALCQAVFGARGGFSEQKLEDYIRTVDEGVRKIRAAQEALRRKYSRRNREILVKYVAMGLVLLLPIEMREALAAFIGSITAFDFLRSNTEMKEEIDAAAAGQFYVAWCLGQAKN